MNLVGRNEYVLTACSSVVVVVRHGIGRAGIDI